MKIIVGKISVLLCVAVLGMFAICSRADEPVSAAKAEPKHGLKIVHRAQAKADKLATLLTQHTKKVADKTEETTVRVVKHVENIGHKVGDAVKKTADHVEKHFDNLFE